MKVEFPRMGFVWNFLSGWEMVIMKRLLRTMLLTAIIALLLSAFALANPYPPTLYEGDLVLVDGGMGVGRYADTTSVVIYKYAPPDYQIAINVVSVTFSEEYWQEHETYVGGPYTIGASNSMAFRYNWITKTISYQRNGKWFDWDINRDHSHAEGEPLIPNTAEVAFATAYNMRFFDKKMGYSPAFGRERRVISESLYDALNM